MSNEVRTGDIAISIVMAVYNAEKYLAHALQSILEQDFFSWELICIDDGSTDNSNKILEKFVNKEPRIKFVSQSNSGPASARSLGYDIACGEYIVQVDSDDFIEKSFLSKLYRHAKKFSANAVMADLMLGSGNEGAGYKSFNEIKGLDFNCQLEPREAFLKTFPWDVHGICLWKANLIKEFAIGENSKINNYNADEYITRLLLLASNMVLVSDAKYFYRSNSDSITRRPDLKRLAALDTNSRLLKLAIDNGFSEKDVHKITVFQVLTFLECYFMLIKNTKVFSTKQIEQAHITLSSYFTTLESSGFNEVRGSKGRFMRLFGRLNYKNFTVGAMLLHKLIRI